MLSLSKFLIEEKNTKHGVMTFGRMNPPTTGHEKVVQKMHDIAQDKGGDVKLVVSHSQDSALLNVSSFREIVGNELGMLLLQMVIVLMNIISHGIFSPLSSC